LNGAEHIESIVLMKMRPKEQFYRLFYSSFGLTPKLGPIMGLGIEKNAIKVDNSWITRQYSRHFRHRRREHVSR
jgi:hypothetical protein